MKSSLLHVLQFLEFWVFFKKYKLIEAKTGDRDENNLQYNKLASAGVVE